MPNSELIDTANRLLAQPAEPWRAQCLSLAPRLRAAGLRDLADEVAAHATMTRPTFLGGGTI